MDFLKRRRVPLAVAGVAVVVAAGYLGFRWRENTGHIPNYGDVPTWLTFIAAAVGIPFAISQFIAQRNQLAEQQKAITEEFARQRKRDELLDEQLAQTRAANRVLIRAQAELVDVKFELRQTRSINASGVGELSTRHMTRVVNNSSRPIRDVKCFLKKEPSALSDPAIETIEIGKYEQVGNMPGMLPKSGEAVALMRPDDEYGFVFDVKTDDAPNAQMYVMFTDDAGTRWHINHDLQLRQDSDPGALL